MRVSTSLCPRLGLQPSHSRATPSRAEIPTHTTYPLSICLCCTLGHRCLHPIIFSFSSGISEALKAGLGEMVGPSGFPESAPFLFFSFRPPCWRQGRLTLSAPPTCSPKGPSELTPMVSRPCQRHGCGLRSGEQGWGMCLKGVYESLWNFVPALRDPLSPARTKP